MAESEQSRSKVRRTEETDVDAPADADQLSKDQQAKIDAHKAEIDSDVDSLLDEIDDVLEVNAEEFVRSFVQKGGQ